MVPGSWPSCRDRASTSCGSVSSWSWRPRSISPRIHLRAGEVCPLWPGQPISAHWGFPDPAAVEGKEAEVRAAFANTYREIATRIEIFTSLPLESLDRLAIERKLDEMGASRRSPAGPD